MAIGYPCIRRICCDMDENTGNGWARVDIDVTGLPPGWQKEGRRHDMDSTEVHHRR